MVFQWLFTFFLHIASIHSNLSHRNGKKNTNAIRYAYVSALQTIQMSLTIDHVHNCYQLTVKVITLKMGEKKCEKKNWEFHSSFEMCIAQSDDAINGEHDFFSFVFLCKKFEILKGNSIWFSHKILSNLWKIIEAIDNIMGWFHCSVPQHFGDW